MCLFQRSSLGTYAICPVATDRAVSDCMFANLYEQILDIV